MTASAVAALYATRPYKDVVMRLSFSTAYPAMMLLALTLVPGPWNLIRRHGNPLSSDLRRDIGMWAGILAILHTAIGQCVHLRGRPWLYYVYGAREHRLFPMRNDLFGFANYAGAASVLVIAALLATSNDFALRRLGPAAWKGLQRWNYAAFALAAAHAIGYLAIERQKLPFVAAVGCAIALTAVLQGAGIAMRLRRG